ncbi:UPF0280 family protein [Tabrizicola sp.]|uniref:UPF0280 family protein n=1 Tax=Tabrizicola sp. TaxID=2005166 RepID=UPI003F328E78
MGQGAMAALLPGGRLHLQHGPIDIVAEAFGDPFAVRAGYARASARFATILEELAVELPVLRSETGALQGVIAQRMAAAVAPFRPTFITPMAAVAGAVAEEVLGALQGPGITRAYVNNGGDIAFHLTPGESLTSAIAVPGALPVLMSSSDAARGIATSGWRGRSWSLGIADAVTVLARTAAMADAAATMIANAVDLPGHPAITRRPACEMQAESDLGDRLVTTGVGPLSRDEVVAALEAGLVTAEAFLKRGLIEAAGLFLQGEALATGALMLPGREGASV